MMQSLKGSDLQGNIIKTVCYSDLFDYPLTSREVWRYLINDTQIESETVQKELKIIADCGRILTDGEFYFLKGRGKIVELRKKREEWSKGKLEIARKMAEKLRAIPGVKMVGITGALAMNNCKEDDDIDLLIITSANTVWVTRFLIIVLCPFLGIKRRKRGETQVKDKICFNLFLDENHLKVGPESLFLAHEICQVKSIFGKGRIYEKLLGENKWVSNFLPNTKNSSKFKVQSSKLQCKIKSLPSVFFRFLNITAYWFQYLYMKPKITNEKISRYQAFFHPKDLSDKIQKEFERRIKRTSFF